MVMNMRVLHEQLRERYKMEAQARDPGFGSVKVIKVYTESRPSYIPNYRDDTQSFFSLPGENVVFERRRVNAADHSEEIDDLCKAASFETKKPASLAESELLTRLNELLLETSEVRE